MSESVARRALDVAHGVLEELRKHWKKPTVSLSLEKDLEEAQTALARKQSELEDAKSEGASNERVTELTNAVRALKGKLTRLKGEPEKLAAYTRYFETIERELDELGSQLGGEEDERPVAPPVEEEDSLKLPPSPPSSPERERRRQRDEDEEQPKEPESDSSVQEDPNSPMVIRARMAAWIALETTLDKEEWYPTQERFPIIVNAIVHEWFRMDDAKEHVPSLVMSIPVFVKTKANEKFQIATGLKKKDLDQLNRRFWKDAVAKIKLKNRDLYDLRVRLYLGNQDGIDDEFKLWVATFMYEHQARPPTYQEVPPKWRHLVSTDKRQRTQSALCGACATPGAYRFCGHCGKVRYCDQQCADAHWPQHNTGK